MSLKIPLLASPPSSFRSPSFEPSPTSTAISPSTFEVEIELNERAQEQDSTAPSSGRSKGQSRSPRFIENAFTKEEQQKSPTSGSTRTPLVPFERQNSDQGTIQAPTAAMQVAQPNTNPVQQLLPRPKQPSNSSRDSRSSRKAPGGASRTAPPLPTTSEVPQPNASSNIDNKPKFQELLDDETVMAVAAKCKALNFSSQRQASIQDCIHDKSITSKQAAVLVQHISYNSFERKELLFSVLLPHVSDLRTQGSGDILADAFEGNFDKEMVKKQLL